MSYDLHIEVPTGRGAETVEVNGRNYTSNVAGMWSQALDAVGWHRGLGDLIDRYGRDDPERVADLCTRAASHMTTHRAEYEAMSPENKWGTVDGARDVLQWIVDELADRRHAVIRCSR